MSEGEIRDADLEAIGRISTQFAFLEFSLAQLAWGLLETEQRVGQTVTAHLSFKRLVALVSALAKQRIKDSSQLARLDTLLSRSLHAESERNTIVHSTWFQDPEEGTTSRLKITVDKGKGRRVQFKTVPTTELDGMADRIADVAAGIQDFATAHGYAKGEIDADQ